jgi:hypothetical protein
MIQAEKAHAIIKLYESDYDNFLGRLKKNRDKKKQEAQQKKSEADKADKTVSEAEAHKKEHLAQNAKDLIDKNGGISGIKDTVSNVMKYFKTDVPSDYQVGFGKTDDEKKPEKTIMGMSPTLVYTAGAIIVIGGILFGLSRITHKSDQAATQITSSNISTH